MSALIVLSQIGSCSAYVYFISSNLFTLVGHLPWQVEKEKKKKRKERK